MRACFFGNSTSRWRTKSGRVSQQSTAHYRLVPPITALVARGKFPVPLEQLRLPAGERDLLAPNEHVLHARRELERVSRPDHDIGHLAGLERAVAIRHTEDLRRSQGHGAQRLVPRHAI